MEGLSALATETGGNTAALYNTLAAAAGL